MSTSSNWHFEEATVQFLNNLRANNDREWFQANKSTYEECFKEPAEFFCQMMAEHLSDQLKCNFTPKIYRIYRDVRFSKDKTPYNAHMHISFSPAGRKMPAYFFGLQPDNLTLGAGTFDFKGHALDTYRKRTLGTEGKKLALILDRLEGLGFRLSEPALKRVPRGFDAESPHAHLLRHKGLAGWYDFPDTAPATSGDLVATCTENFIRLQPLVKWLADC